MTDLHDDLRALVEELERRGKQASCVAASPAFIGAEQAARCSTLATVHRETAIRLRALLAKHEAEHERKCAEVLQQFEGPMRGDQ